MREGAYHTPTTELAQGARVRTIRQKMRESFWRHLRLGFSTVSSFIAANCKQEIRAFASLSKIRLCIVTCYIPDDFYVHVAGRLWRPHARVAPPSPSRTGCPPSKAVPTFSSYDMRNVGWVASKSSLNAPKRQFAADAFPTVQIPKQLLEASALNRISANYVPLFVEQAAT